MSTPLQLFLARLATDARTFEAYLRDPDEVFREAGLSAADRAALEAISPSWSSAVTPSARIDDAGPHEPTPTSPEPPIVTQPVTYAVPIFVAASAGPGPVLPTADVGDASRLGSRRRDG